MFATKAQTVALELLHGQPCGHQACGGETPVCYSHSADRQTDRHARPGGCAPRDGPWGGAWTRATRRTVVRGLSLMSRTGAGTVPRTDVPYIAAQLGCLRHEATQPALRVQVALVQFCISPPKTDLENNVIVSDYQQMDRCAVVTAGAPAGSVFRRPHPRPREDGGSRGLARVLCSALRGSDCACRSTAASRLFLGCRVLSGAHEERPLRSAASLPAAPCLLSRSGSSKGRSKGQPSALCGTCQGCARQHRGALLSCRATPSFAPWLFCPESRQQVVIALSLVVPRVPATCIPWPSLWMSWSRASGRALRPPLMGDRRCCGVVSPPPPPPLR